MANRQLKSEFKRWYTAACLAVFMTNLWVEKMGLIALLLVVYVVVMGLIAGLSVFILVGWALS